MSHCGATSHLRLRRTRNGIRKESEIRFWRELRPTKTKQCGSVQVLGNSRCLCACGNGVLLHSYYHWFFSIWALGAVASASRLHRVGRGFESLSAHHFTP